MATSAETETSVAPEKRTIFNRIIAATFGWQEARAAAERNAHMDAWLNLQERDAFAPIDRALEELVEIDPSILERSYE